MHDFWWRLPGPSRFVTTIAQELRDGRSVVLCLPDQFPNGFVGMLQAALSDGMRDQWYRLEVDSESCAPIDLLYARFIPDCSPQEIRNVANLIAHDLFSGRLVWLDRMTSQAWPAWKRFLSDYEHACRSASLLERTLFCVPLFGELSLDPPAEDVCLAKHCWRGVVDYTDILLFSSSSFQFRRETLLVKRVAVFVAAGLALWDPEVVERLARARIDDILNPIGILCRIAKDRGWSDSVSSHRGTPWHRGWSDLFEGRERLHSAILASRGSRDEIQRRIWNAEVSVMFPFVEEQRQDMLDRLRGFLQVPFKTRFGDVIDDVRDLEIGHIEAQLRNAGANADSELLRLAQRLREVRNRLAHLETLPLDLLTD